LNVDNDKYFMLTLYATLYQQSHSWRKIASGCSVTDCFSGLYLSIFRTYSGPMHTITGFHGSKKRNFSLFSGQCNRGPCAWHFAQYKYFDNFDTIM